MSKRAEKDPYAFDVSRWRALRPGRGIFVTGSGQGVGKTLVAGAIARRLRGKGVRVEVFKPVATGCRQEREGLISAEAEFLAACAESRATLVEIAPARYRQANCPASAAGWAGKPVDLDAVFEAYDQAVGRGECLIVEGPGGLCTPWSEGFWTVHFAMMTALPLVVVVEAGVGAVNQSLLAAAVARSAGLKVAGVVLNRYRVDPDTRKALDRRGAPAEIEADDLAAYTNPSQISEHGGLVVLAIVPFDGESSVEQATLSFDVEFAVGVTDWQRVAGL